LARGNLKLVNFNWDRGNQPKTNYNKNRKKTSTGDRFGGPGPDMDRTVVKVVRGKKKAAVTAKGGGTLRRDSIEDEDTQNSLTSGL